MSSRLAADIKARARALGFDLCGIAPADPSLFRAAFLAWLEKNYHGEMAYMARDPERRLDPHLVLPGARSLVVVAMNYYTESEADHAGPDEAVFARYARNEDYHDVMLPRLRALLAFIQERAPDTEGRAYVDTGPILEREAAQRAGLGWFGKNTMLINTRRGSYFLLGVLLLTLPLPPDEPARGGCGTCTRCLEACPTGAIVRPYEVDARRCISYLTIEQKGPIPPEYASELGNRIFGCDICQEVCPINRTHSTARYPTLFPTEEPAFQPRESTINMKVTELLYMKDEEFRAAFKSSPVKRAKRRGLLRNAAASLSSRDDPEAIAALEHALNDPDPLVREQAQQSLEAIRARREVDGRTD